MLRIRAEDSERIFFLEILRRESQWLVMLATGKI